MIEINDEIAIGEDEIKEVFIHAGGPGGQNVNKVASAVQLRFDVRRSPTLPKAVRQRAERLAGRRLTKDGIVVIEARRYRSQERNRMDARARLADLLKKAAKPPAIRKATRPTRASRQRRLETKKQRGALKKLRTRRPGEE